MQPGLATKNPPKKPIKPPKITNKKIRVFISEFECREGLSECCDE
jgi:hypothetical protein